VANGTSGFTRDFFPGQRNSLAAEDLPDAKKVQRWYFVAGVDVATTADAFTMVVLGDSITDGRGSTTDGNNRWPDILAKRLQASAATQKIGVVNQGIGGNRLLLDGIARNALARFDHDVLAQAGVRCLIVLEGINDLGMLTHEKEVSEAEHEAEVRRVIGAYEQIIARAHAQRIKVIGATILPFVGSAFYHPTAKNEADRQAVNEWIRKHFDGVLDFDKLLRDPAHPEMMLSAYDSEITFTHHRPDTGRWRNPFHSRCLFLAIGATDLLEPIRRSRVRRVRHDRGILRCGLHREDEA